MVPAGAGVVGKAVSLAAPGTIESLIGGLREHPLVDRVDTPPRVALVGLGPSSLDLQVRCQVLTGEYPQFVEVQQELLLDALSAVEGVGTSLAFPSTTMYLAGDRPDALDTQDSDSSAPVDGSPEAPMDTAESRVTFAPDTSGSAGS